MQKYNLGIPEIYSIVSQSDLSQYRAVDLLVPCDDTFQKYHDSEKKQIKIQKAKKTGTIRQNEAIKAWRYVSGIPTITSQTLFPIGILIMMYNDVFFDKDPPNEVSDHPISKLVFDECNIIIDRPSDLVPFAALLGFDIFQANSMTD